MKNMKSENANNRFYLSQFFGDTVQVRIVELLLIKMIQEQKSEEIVWLNFSDVAREAKVAKSSAKRILDLLIFNNFIEVTCLKISRTQIISVINKQWESFFFLKQGVTGNQSCS